MKKQHQEILDKIIALLFSLQIFLIGLEAKSRIENGESTLKVLIWMNQQYISVLKHSQSLKEKRDQSDSQ